MKWLALLFAFYILALSAMPCCGKDCCTEETTRQAKFPNKKEAPCSPFFTCNSCHAFVIPETTIALTTPFAKRTVISTILNNNEAQVLAPPPGNRRK